MWQSQIDSVMDNFDFGKVADVMRLLNWQWSSCACVPAESDLRIAARKLLKDVIAMKPNSFCGSGGLMARKIGETDLWLSFEIEKETTLE